MSEISEITQRTNAGTQEAAMSVSYLSELSDQLRASVSTFRLPERVSESTDTFGGMASMPSLPGGDMGDQFYQQDTGSNGDWNQNFSADFLSLPQNQENDMGGNGFQFTFNGQGQQDFAPQPGFGNQSGFGGMPQLPAAQQGFDNQAFGNFPPSFQSQPGFGELSPFDTQQSFESQPFGGQPFGNQPFGNQPFGNVPESGYGQPGQPAFPVSSQMPAISQPNFPPPSGGQAPGRPRWRNPQQGSDQMPFPGAGNGHVGQ
jgi:hypothetical protein